ncbi:MAG: Rpn family recombination-promoting nuclease/putative transposase [Chloroflexi bacterium]|nr:Rpn family recombination-promoting nuclease/putative transposase [Chloroflexota bacterium]
MSDLSNPHDKFFKETFTRLEVARDFFANYIPESVTTMLKCTMKIYIFIVVIMIASSIGCTQTANQPVITVTNVPFIPIEPTLTRINVDVVESDHTPSSQIESTLPTHTSTLISTPKPTSVTAPTPSLQFRAINIAFDHIIDFSWTVDGQKLLYQTPSQFWEYDIATGQTTALNINSLIPTSEVTSMLPDTASNLSLAPSGNSYMYLDSIEPTKTPSPDLGEQYLGGELAELWVNHDENSFVVAQLDNCIVETRWANNEMSFILLPDIHANCIDGAGIHVSLEDNKTQLIFPEERFPHFLSIQSLSFDGSKILFVEKIDDLQRVSILNVPTLEISTIYLSTDVQNSLINIDWIISNLDIFVIYYEDINGNRIVSIYDSVTDTSFPILSNQTLKESNALGDISRISLAPNDESLAFTTEIGFETEGLWIIEIEYP